MELQKLIRNFQNEMQGTYMEINHKTKMCRQQITHVLFQINQKQPK